VLVFSIKETRSFEYAGGTLSGDYKQRISYLNGPTAYDRIYDNSFNTVYVSSSLTNVTGTSG
jgi:ubiquinone/menaquinone biosynthesis C-methylase UbiE